VTTTNTENSVIWVKTGETFVLSKIKAD